MKFYKIGPLGKWHDVGLIYDDSGVLGSALRVNGSSKHPDSVSINDKALKVASVSFNFIHFSYDNIEQSLPTKEAIDIIHVYGIRPYHDADYRVLDKSHIRPKVEVPVDDLPF